jgi:hypothetical protein
MLVVAAVLPLVTCLVSNFAAALEVSCLLLFFATETLGAE